MRWNMFSLLLAIAGAGVGLHTAQAQQSCNAAPQANCAAPSACATGGLACDTCNSCDPCGGGCFGGRCGGHFGAGGCWGGHCPGTHFSRGYEGLDRHFNCGCNGSYKYPVPPLYTYHWPGLYSQQLMTDYHSPWRFPPIKPYTDEVLQPYPTGTGAPAPEESLPPAPPSMGQNRVNSRVQNAEYATSSTKIPGSAESMSDKLKRSSQYLP